MMTNEQLEKTIEQFNDLELKGEAVFGIFQYGGGPDESFIKANKNGLILFAHELLKAARDSDAILSNTEIKYIPLDYTERWIDQDSNTVIQYIEPISNVRKTKPITQYKSTFVEKLLPFGCLLILIILLIAVFIGLGTMIREIF